MLSVAINCRLIYRKLLLRILAIGARHKLEDLHLYYIFKADCYSRLLVVFEGKSIFEQ
jgi:hypothetical protein